VGKMKEVRWWFGSTPFECDRAAINGVRHVGATEGPQWPR
jgi:hypothetical protein